MPFKSGAGEMSIFVGAVAKEPRGGDGIPCGGEATILESGLKGGEGELVSGSAGSVEQRDVASVGGTDSFTQRGGR